MKAPQTTALLLFLFTTLVLRGGAGFEAGKFSAEEEAEMLAAMEKAAPEKNALAVFILEKYEGETFEVRSVAKLGPPFSLDGERQFVSADENLVVQVWTCSVANGVAKLEYGLLTGKYAQPDGRRKASSGGRDRAPDTAGTRSPLWLRKGQIQTTSSIEHQDLDASGQPGPINYTYRILVRWHP